jgi:hypothetical protein
VVGGIVQTNVFEVIVAGSTRVFKCGRLENGHTDSPANKWFRFAGVDEFGFDVLVIFGHELFLRTRFSKESRLGGSGLGGLGRPGLKPVEYWINGVLEKLNPDTRRYFTRH